MHPVTAVFTIPDPRLEPAPSPSSPPDPPDPKPSLDPAPSTDLSDEDGSYEEGKVPTGFILSGIIYYYSRIVNVFIISFSKLKLLKMKLAILASRAFLSDNQNFPAAKSYVERDLIQQPLVCHSIALPLSY